MKFRLKDNRKITGRTGDFNTASASEIVLWFDHGDADSSFQTGVEVWLEKKKQWKHLPDAFRDKDVIVDNYNTRFFEPPTEEDRERGYTLS